MVGYRFHHHPKKMHKLSKDCFKGKSGSPNASLLLGLFPGVGPRCARARGREALPPAGEVLGARRLARGRIGDRNWGFSRFSPMVFPELEVQPPESAKTRDETSLTNDSQWSVGAGWLLLNSYYCLLRQQFFTVFGLYDHPIKATITEVWPQEDQEDAFVLLLSPLRIIQNYTHTPMTHKKIHEEDKPISTTIFFLISANILVYPFYIKRRIKPISCSNRFCVFSARQVISDLEQQKVTFVVWAQDDRAVGINGWQNPVENPIAMGLMGPI